MAKKKQATLTVELIEQSRNRTISEMFTDENAGQEIDRFVAKHRLLLEKEYVSGEPSGFVLSGDEEEVREFMRTFLSEDSGGGVYIFNTRKE